MDFEPGSLSENRVILITRQQQNYAQTWLLLTYGTGLDADVMRNKYELLYEITDAAYNMKWGDSQPIHDISWFHPLLQPITDVKID